MSFTVAIVGRPNVGKSTLFNRLIGQKKSITDDLSGVTRDRLYGECFWNGKTFTVIDTGGFVAGSNDVFESAIRNQVHTALNEADRIFFLTDVTTGITGLDSEIANILRKRSKDVYLVVNKVDNSNRLYESNEFYGLGFEKLFTISSITGGGTGELLDSLTDEIPNESEENKEENVPRIAILGQPNVGKSSMVNAFLGEDRNIVTDIAGTTRDAIHSRFNKFNHDIVLIDTAGIRKKSKVTEDLEFYSVIRSIKAIDEADVCILVLDASLGITHQDLSILNQIERKKRGLLIAVNKWDKIDKNQMTYKEFEKRILEKTAPFADIPILFTSAIDKTRLLKVLEEAVNIYGRMKTRISTSKLNDFLQLAVEENHPPSFNGNFIKIKYVAQLPVKYPAFAFFCNHPKYIKQPYRNYLENRLREKFSFTGVPLTIYFREK